MKLRKIVKKFIIRKLHGKDGCEGHQTWTDWGYEYDCGYSSEILCEDCLFSNKGFNDPRKKEEGIYNKIIVSLLNKLF